MVIDAKTAKPKGVYPLSFVICSCVTDSKHRVAAVYCTYSVGLGVCGEIDTNAFFIRFSFADGGADTQYREWLKEQYSKIWKLILSAFSHSKVTESTQALVTAMRLFATECKYPRDPLNKSITFSSNKLNNIVQQLLSSNRVNNHLFNRFKEYGAYLDVVFYTWKILPGITVKGVAPSDIYIQNYLDLINTIPISAEVQENKQLFCTSDETFEFDYPVARKSLNKVWSCVLLWQLSETTHKQMLIVLLEKILNHLDKPVLLTDFLMDSLDVGEYLMCDETRDIERGEKGKGIKINFFDYITLSIFLGGPISLLALQGVFTLIQQHNLTYPKLYEKLYSMFEPEIFHTKFKARLFYLADIFLSSSHLPENLVAAFVKRLARLSLVAPPQDIVTIIYFIGNLILRHPGLKRLICHPIGNEIPQDPYIMDERDPIQSNALESSLWEIASLQQHLIPSVAQAAKIIISPLPKGEWNLSNYLEINENDVSGIMYIAQND